MLNSVTILHKSASQFTRLLVYMTDIFSLIPFLTFVSVLFIFAYVLGQRKRTVVNTSFLIFVFFMMAAPLIDFVIRLTDSAEIESFLYKILIPLLFSLGFLFLNFVFTLINKKRNTIYQLCMIGLVFSIIVINYRPPLTMVYFPDDKMFIPVPNMWFVIPFIVTLILIPSYALLLCVKQMVTEKNSIVYNQLRLVILGAFISTLFTVFTIFIGPLLLNNYTFLRLASLGILINSLFMFRAVQRHFLASVNIEQIENAFNRLFENSHDSVILLDAQGTAIQVNDSAVKLFGSQVAPISKEFLTEHISGYDFWRNGTDISSIYKNGDEIRHIQISQSLIKGSDVSFGKLLIIQDITIQKRSEQLILDAKNLESIGQLAGGIAHDFNNLLCGIVSNLALANSDIDPACKASELIAISEKTALHARDLARQLLTFSKGDIKKNEIFDVIELICDTTTFMKHGSKAAIMVNLPTVPVLIKADKGQIREVFQNLIMNAIESMPNGGTITIDGKTIPQCFSNGSCQKELSFFQVSIADQGIGIAAEHLSRIFEPYFTTKANGNGLGLSIVKSIINKVKGNLSIKVNEGIGTTFTVCLPITDERSIKVSRNPAMKISSPGRILIMDDYPTIRLSLAMLLQRMGYTVDQASSGNQALEIYDKTVENYGDYQAVITDLNVPGAMGGKILVNELHKRNPDLCVIVSSGYSEEIEIDQYRKFGFAGVLHKPYSQEELQEVLGTVLAVS